MVLRSVAMASSVLGLLVHLRRFLWSSVSFLQHGHCYSVGLGIGACLSRRLLPSGCWSWTCFM
jgi:hypothetical protein